MADRWLDRIDPEIAPVVARRPIEDFTNLASRQELTARNRQARREAFVADARVEIIDHVVHRGDGELVIRGYHSRSVSGLRPGIYWIHGGGHLVGSVDQDDALLQEWCIATGCDAFSVDWRASPDDPFPAEMVDAVTGLQWLVDHADEFAIDTTRLVVGGASSGGGSATALVLLLRDNGLDGALDALAMAAVQHAGGPAAADRVERAQRGRHDDGFKPAGLLAIYPMLDDRNQTASSQRVVEPRVWNRDKNLFAWECYLGTASGGPAVSPYAAPARSNDLSGLPPVVLATGALDLFVDENLEFASRLLDGGGDIEMHLYPSVPHGFFSAVPDAALSRRLITDVAEGLRRLFDMV